MGVLLAELGSAGLRPVEGVVEFVPFRFPHPRHDVGDSDDALIFDARSQHAVGKYRLRAKIWEMSV